MSRKWMAIAAKAAISAFLIWYLVDRVDLTQVATRARALDPGEAILCLAILAAQTLLVTMRWWLVAQTIEIPLTFGSALRILLIGMFFNQTLPSAVGGDAVRVWLVSRDGATLRKAFNLVLCDRVLAVGVLIGVIGVSLPAVYEYIPDDAMRSALTLLVALTGSGLAAFLLFGRPIAHQLSRWTLTRPFGDLASDFRRLLAHLGPASAAVGLSAGVHALTILVVVLLAWGLDLPVTFVGALVVVPTVILLTTLPLSVAGWGVREGAMVTGFGYLGIPMEGSLTLSVLFGLAQVAVALPGGVVWLIVERARAQPSSHQSRESPTS